MTENELSQIREFFLSDRFAMKTCGIEIEAIGKKSARCSLKIDDRHLNANNSVMGGAIFTLADFTFAVASNHDGEKTVTLNSNITYLSAAKGDVLYAESRLIKDGRSTCTYEITVNDNLGTHVAVVMVCGMKIKS